jgi:F-type H+-transporting ATPase subunit epsilon
MTIRVEIVSQDCRVFEGDVDMVTLPGIEGEMGILPGHAPLLSSLAYGIIRLKGEEDHAFTVAGGIVEVLPDVVTVLADAAEDVNEINIERAKAAKKRAEEILKNAPPEGKEDYLAIEAALRRSNLRLEAVQKYRYDKRYTHHTDED